MVIQHNMQASYANMMTGITTSERAKTAEKLASGYKINRAADNAASLTISEKMRRQMRGLTRASSNGKDGISMAQVADGALHEVHEMLQRCNVLSIQAANGTLAPEDRIAINNEIKQLKSEINAITSRTKFNETPIFPKKGRLPRLTTLNPPSSIANGMKYLAQKISNEYFPNAVEQILNSFSPMGNTVRTAAENDKTPYYSTMTINTIDGVDNVLASMSAQISWPGQNFTPGSLLLSVDKADFPSLNLSQDKLSLLESTVAHEVMHGVMATVYPERMNIGTGPEDFPLWFIEGTAQLSGGGYSSGWNSYLSSCASTLSSANDPSRDYNIAAYLSQGGQYTVDGRVYGHGYLAAAYAGYLASDTNDFSKATILTGMNKIFQGFIDNKTDSFDTVLTSLIGISESDLKDCINNGSYSSPVSGKMGAVEFVRRLSYESLGGVGSLITPSLSTGGTNILGETAKKNKQPIEIMNTTLGYVQMDLTTENQKGRGSSIALHLGTDADMTNKVEIELFDMSTDALLITDVNLLTEDNATNAIDKFSNAILMVSGVRSYFGAIQNRVEHTVYNLNNVVENTTAAESRLRDADMAEEMVRLSTLNILQQAGQSVLAQANQTPQGVMALLQ
ncbi:flagellin [Butyrivibrio sp. ob235]|uniref:flagellinolysin n=1 Tax=Butyrivibrio sp. ob235 TaxID=1761780 RepID=UPI0008C5F376|nr:flagellinolysin [Butyrivibrio sp. ob235]SEM50944.1 flagellin [Butyrivibrio sp. ob235]